MGPMRAFSAAAVTVAATCACAAAGFAAAASAASTAPTDAASGRQLFDGGTPLTARIVGQDFTLPGRASRCANCHVTKAIDHPEPTAAAARSRRFGPPLTAARLLESMPRRGGPPSRYDRETFCKLLRTGIDPAFVVIDRSMPRYQLDAAQCQALWSHLAGSP